MGLLTPELYSYNYSNADDLYYFFSIQEIELDAPKLRVAYKTNINNNKFNSTWRKTEFINASMCRADFGLCDRISGGLVFMWVQISDTDTQGESV